MFCLKWRIFSCFGIVPCIFPDQTNKQTFFELLGTPRWLCDSSKTYYSITFCIEAVPLTSNHPTGLCSVNVVLGLIFRMFVIIL